jgi:hypothetical protein
MAEDTITSTSRRMVKMIESSVMVDVLIREREAELRALALRRAAYRSSDSERDRRHSLRERLGFSLIQAGRALLRHGSAYASAPRRLA